MPAGFEHLKEAAKLAAGQPNQEGAAAENGDEEEEEYSEQLRDLEPKLIEMVLQQIYNIYL